MRITTAIISATEIGKTMKIFFINPARIYETKDTEATVRAYGS